MSPMFWLFYQIPVPIKRSQRYSLNINIRCLSSPQNVPRYFLYHLNGSTTTKTDLKCQKFDSIWQNNSPCIMKSFKPMVWNPLLQTVSYHINQSGVSWPSGLAYRTQVLVLAAECGFESRPWHLCPWARHLIIIASLHPGVKWVPVRAELVD